MPEPQPTEDILSQPVEPDFRNLVSRVIDESLCYGFNKYGTELKTFNGRRELQDFAEEWVSAGRYVTQLAMRCHKYEELLIKAYQILESHDLLRELTTWPGDPCPSESIDRNKFLKELNAAVGYATRSELT
jgi:hypothetical protein